MEEKIQLVTGYRLKALDMGMRKRLRTASPESELKDLKAFYDERVKLIISAKGGPLGGLPPGSKRKADNDHQEEPDNRSKKSKADDTLRPSPSSLSNGTGQTGSQTSSLFRNILGGTTQAASISKAADKPTFVSSNASETPAKSSSEKASAKTPLFIPKVPELAPLPSQPTSASDSPFKGFSPSVQGAAASKEPNFFSGHQSTVNGLSATTSASEANKPSPSASMAPASGSSSVFAVGPSTNGENGSQPPQAPAFKMPTFGGGAPANFMAQFGAAAQQEANKQKEKRKLEDLDSDEDEDEWERKYQEEERAKKQKIEHETKGKVLKMVSGKMQWAENNEDVAVDAATSKESALKPPPSVFDQPHAPLANGHNIFGHLSGEDSGAESSKTADADDEDEEYDEDDEDDVQDSKKTTLISKTPQVDNQKAVGNPLPDPSTQAAAPAAPTTTPSLFDRISKDENGNPIREIPKSDAKPSIFANLSKTPSFATSNLFSQAAATSTTSTNGKDSSTPSQGLFRNLSSSTASHSIFGKQTSSTSASDSAETSGSPTGDHTWKPETPIKFGASTGAPAVNVTSPSPSKSPFGGLFGAAKNSTSSESPAKPVFNPFAITPAKTAATGLGFGFTPTNSQVTSLAPPASAISTSTSRATSPGLTTGESANESTAEKDEDDAAKDDQVDLMSGGPGEENEEVLFTVKAKAHGYDHEKKTWITKGLGPLRLLKHRDTGNTRILMRQDPTGKVVLNSSLLKGLTYEKSSSKQVRVPIVNEEGKIERIVIKVAQDEDAQKLASILSEQQPK